MRRRIIILVVLIVTVAYWPWWFSGLLALIAVWRFDSGYELLLPAILADLVYGLPLIGWLNFAFPATVLTAVAIALSKILVSRFFLRS
ncbi:MAG: hypothetical protein V1704_03400 [Candidatus Vogelbacteria bacterium]